MPRRSILWKTVVDDRLQILGYGLTLAVMAAVIVYLWPSYEDTLVTVDLPPALEALLGSSLSFATGPGFISAEFFSWIPALLLVYAIVKGTGAVAGEESAGTMDMLLAQREPRLRGIVNGIDVTEWDPATDTHLAAK